ncbi:pre-tRNA nuclear export protein [Tulasnella sp. JGI-2019a]|nr:pre-tRNA nuclear export protein [Tulasnella sp. JGI-2019a]
MESQIISAIEIAADPAQDRTLQAQAVEFLNVLRTNAKEYYSLALTFFLTEECPGSRKYSAHVRTFALQLLDDFLDAETELLDEVTFQTLKGAVVSYIRSEYIQGSAEASSPWIRNKFSHTVALLFLRSYPERWPEFFPTMYSLLRPSLQDPDTNGAGLPPINPHISVLFLRVLNEISGEVHDQILKSARVWTEDRQNRDIRVRSTIREKEAENMNKATLTIISEAEDRMCKIREAHKANGFNYSQDEEYKRLEDVIALGVRAFAGYVQWVDINLTVNQNTVPLIFKLLADPSSRIRQATAYALLRLVTKGLKAPSDKLQLIRVLSLGEVLESLEAKSRRPPGSEENEDEDLYREGLGKLANSLGLELVDLLGEAELPQEGREITEQLVAQLLPVCIQFLADPFDDTSSTVFTFFNQLFSHYKKARKAAPQTHLTDQKRQFLTTTLNVILQKLKWDSDGLADEDEYEDMDDDDRGAFEKMRQDLRVLLNAILEIDEELVTAVVRTIAMSTLSAFENARNSGATGASGISWQDAELAAYLVYLYGELRSNRAEKGRFNFVQMPPELVANKEKRKFVDSSTLPLTAHGEMMDALVKSNISTYPHVAVRTQFFESVGRYIEFFKARKECIMPVLHALVDERGMHQSKRNRRGRIFYVFHRFVKDLRSDIPKELVESLLNSIQDLLAIEVSQSDLESDNYSSSSKGSSPTPGQDAGSILEDAVKSAGFFDNQLYLFEAVGTLVSVRSDPEQQVLLQVVINPILSQLSEILQRSIQTDVLAVLKVHHLLQALASVAKGFPEMSETNAKTGLPSRIESFKQIGEAALVTLDALISYRIIRDATRFTFTRLIAAAGVSVAQFIPTLTSRLLAVVTEPLEVVDFISFLGFVFYSHLGTEIWDMLDQLILPLNSKIAAIISASEEADQKPHFEIKKAYLDFTLTIMGGPLYMVYISHRNAPQFESLVGGVIGFASDATYPPLQKSAFGLLAAFATQFGAPEGSTVVVRDRSKANAVQEMQVHHVPGFERVIYERLIPMAFDVPAAPNFNSKDPQSLQVLFEIGVMLKATHKARGQEVLDFLANEYLPSKNSPQETTIDFVTKLRDLDSKGFRKYFSDFVRSSLKAAQS